MRRKVFEFEFPVNYKESGRILFAGNLVVSGSAVKNTGSRLRSIDDASQIEITIDTVHYNGVDVELLLRAAESSGSSLLENIHEAAEQHAFDLFENSRIAV